MIEPVRPETQTWVWRARGTGRVVVGLAHLHAGHERHFAICVCYIESASAAQVGYAVRRLRRKVPDAFILIALLGNHTPGEETDQLRQASNADAIETTLEGVRERLVGHTKRAFEPPTPEKESATVLTLTRT